MAQYLHFISIMNDQPPLPPQKTQTNWIEKLTLGITVIGIMLVVFQLFQANEHKRWDNYNAMNAAYHALYEEIYDGSHDNLLNSYSHITSLNKKQLAWVRSYFDLYAEEYWLDQKCLIPTDMFGKQIDNGVNLNLTEHPVMISGYKYWRDKGAFKHPQGFIKFVDEKALCLESKNAKKPNISCTANKSKNYSRQNLLTCLF